MGTMGGVKGSVVLLLSCMFICGCAKSGERDQVENAFRDYMSGWQKQDTQRVWELMSPRQKLGNDNNPEGFAKFVKQHGFHPSAYTIRKIGVDGDKATIEAIIQYVDQRGNKFGPDELDEFRFIRQANHWYFDDYKPVHGGGTEIESDRERARDRSGSK